MSFKLVVDSLFASPYAMSVYVALTEKGLPFSLETMDLEAGVHRRPPYRDLALTGRIPALVHDGFVLTESSAITEYLDEAFPAPQYTALYPQEIHRRARARQLQGWLRSGLMPLRVERDTESVFFRPTNVPLSAEAQLCADQVIRAAEQLVDGAHLFGQWSIADTDLAMMLQRLIVNGDPVPPRLRDYADAQWQRPSVQRWLAHHQPN
ncbi:glutathione transferase [Duganella sp. LX20W]|uniref:Glutathione transferase n=1 Tax=Rugamonas brunnea TaxID=2758569 RepID=A0A7W2EQJ1_9BURK|nr:glutathione transferase [Rugamonas brunnea]MBA5636772.1 glutathione transferase [Rugamonas brunnea]